MRVKRKRTVINNTTWLKIYKLALAIGLCINCGGYLSADDPKENSLSLSEIIPQTLIEKNLSEFCSLPANSTKYVLPKRHSFSSSNRTSSLNGAKVSSFVQIEEDEKNDQDFIGLNETDPSEPSPHLPGSSTHFFKKIQLGNSDFPSKPKLEVYSQKERGRWNRK